MLLLYDAGSGVWFAHLRTLAKPDVSTRAIPIWLHVYEYNERGIRTYEKIGFQKEGVLRQDTYREGRYWDTIVMAILREEWDVRKADRSPY